MSQSPKSSKDHPQKAGNTAPDKIKKSKRSSGKPLRKSTHNTPDLAHHGSTRIVGASILHKVLVEHLFLDEAMGEAFSRSTFSSNDKAFVRRLVTQTLRHLRLIDQVLDTFIKRKLGRKESFVLQCLRLGAAQFLLLEGPKHAAVYETVKAVRTGGFIHMVKFTNAVMRGVAQNGADIFGALDVTRQALPEWIWDKWSQIYGAEQTRLIAAQYLRTPPIDLTLKDPLRLDFWLQDLNASAMPGGETLRIPTGRGRIEEMPGYDSGDWWVQDFAASIPARLLTNKAQNTPRGLILDLCAAPGGKTAQLLSRLAPLSPNNLIALEKNPKRAERLQGNLDRLHLSGTVIVDDLLRWSPAQKAAAILLDAPCSATGTLRHNPDVAHKRSADDIQKLVKLQDAMLLRVADWLEVGGLLVYTTCSLEPEEGEWRVEKFLAEHPAFARVPVNSKEVAGLDDIITQAGDVRTLPFYLAEDGGMDGFFACRLTRLF